MSKKIVKVMVFYEDGTFAEIANGTGITLPTFPPAPAPKPSTLPADWWLNKQHPVITPYTVTPSPYTTISDSKFSLSSSNDIYTSSLK
jgi:hypothetical protein